MSSSGCTTNTHGSNDCSGSGKNIPNSSCYGGGYGSVSVSCSG